MPRVESLKELQFSPKQQRALGDDYDLSISATGNDSQANAYQITTSVAYITTCAAGSADSAKLPLAKTWLRGFVFVCNDGAGTLNLFPNTGDSINTGAANAKIQVTSGGRVIMVRVSDTKWLWF